MKEGSAIVMTGSVTGLLGNKALLDYSLTKGGIHAFARSLATSVSAVAPELDTRVSAVSEGWPADRLGTLERNILRIGVFELEENAVPMDVAINEAVVLAKRYASEDAARLVNGILARIAKDGR